MEIIETVGTQYSFPPKAQWQVNIGGIIIETLNSPNAFYRLTQRIILGFKWEKLG